MVLSNGTLFSIHLVQ